MKDRKGKIYFVSAPGRIKIGFTTKPEARLSQLRNADFEELTVIGVVDSYMSIEGKLHTLVEDHRIKGEWFKDCPEVRAVADDFIGGKIIFAEKIPAMAPRPADLNALINLIEARSQIRNDAMEQADKLLTEIERRIERKESVSDLVKSACFLAEHIIAPLDHGPDAARRLRGLDRT